MNVIFPVVILLVCFQIISPCCQQNQMCSVKCRNNDLKICFWLQICNNKTVFCKMKCRYQPNDSAATSTSISPSIENPTISTSTEAPTTSPSIQAPTTSPSADAPTTSPSTEAPATSTSIETPTISTSTEAPTTSPSADAPTTCTSSTTYKSVLILMSSFFLFLLTILVSGTCYLHFKLQKARTDTFHFIHNLMLEP